MNVKVIDDLILGFLFGERRNFLEIVDEIILQRKTKKINESIKKRRGVIRMYHMTKNLGEFWVETEFYWKLIVGQLKMDISSFAMPEDMCHYI